MDLIITGNVAKHVLMLTKRDPQLARALAQQWVERVNSGAMNAYLMQGGLAAELLAERLIKRPEQTLEELYALERGGAAPKKAASKGKQKKPAKGTNGVGQKTASAAPVDSGKAKARKGKKRVRLSTAQVEKLKAAVVQYIAKHPGAKRKGIEGAVSIPSAGIYNRVMEELVEGKQLEKSGHRALAVYSVRGGAVKPSGTEKPAAKSAARKRGRPAKAAVAAQ